MTDRRATRQTARFPTNRGSEDQDTVSEDSNTGLSRNSSTETVIEVNQNREDVDKIVIKLDRLQDKSTRYESHKEFLEKCIREKVIPDGLRVDVEPTIGNHDEEFLSIWYNKLESFSVELMQEIVKFCDKILAQTKDNIKVTDTTLKRIAPKEEYHNVQLLIARNVENNRRSLNQRKTRKFNKIKYRPKRVTSGEKKKSTTRQVGNSEYQLFRGRHLPRETPSASSRESSAERPRSRERDQQSTSNTNIGITTRRPTYADILSRPKGQSHQNRTRSQFGFQQRQQREQRQRENRSVQFQDATSEEWNEDKPRSWVQKNDQTASVGNRGVEQLLEQALQGIQQNTQAIARLEENLSSFAPYRIHQEKW